MFLFGNLAIYFLYFMIIFEYQFRVRAHYTISLFTHRCASEAIEDRRSEKPMGVARLNGYNPPVSFGAITKRQEAVHVVKRKRLKETTRQNKCVGLFIVLTFCLHILT